MNLMIILYTREQQLGMIGMCFHFENFSKSETLRIYQMICL